MEPTTTTRCCLILRDRSCRRGVAARWVGGWLMVFLLPPMLFLLACMCCGGKKRRGCKWLPESQRFDGLRQNESTRPSVNVVLCVNENKKMTTYHRQDTRESQTKTRNTRHQPQRKNKEHHNRGTWHEGQRHTAVFAWTRCCVSRGRNDRRHATHAHSVYQRTTGPPLRCDYRNGVNTFTASLGLRPTL